MDQITNLLVQLYKPEAFEENSQSGDDSLQQELSEGNTTPMEQNFSQFSDNAVLSPPTTNNQRVLPAVSADLPLNNDEHLFFTDKESTTTTAGSGCSSSQQSAELQEDFSYDLTELESPDVENQMLLPLPSKEADERSADTVIIASEDASSENNKERPLKMITSGLCLKNLFCECKLVMMTICY